VSTGCANCYAEKMAKRLTAIGVETYKGTIDDAGNWTGKINLASDQVIMRPLQWKTPKKIFVNSMSDLFHPNVPVEMIDLVFKIIRACPQHTFQVLTKRPERAFKLIRPYKPRLNNLWLGVSIENNSTCNERMKPLIVDDNANKTFVSFEPLLGLINLHIAGFRAWFDWAIIGAESGPKHRPCDHAWIRHLIAQCDDWGIPVFVKQIDAKKTKFEDWPADLQRREFPHFNTLPTAKSITEFLAMIRAAKN